MRAPLPQLALGEQGFVLGVRAAGGGPAVAARLADAASASRCRQALEALAAEDGAGESPAEGLAAELRRVVRAPVPDGLGRVHPGWIRRALDGESALVIRAVTAGLAPEVEAVAAELLSGRDEVTEAAPAVGPDVVDELRRTLFGGFVPMPAAGDGETGAALLEKIDRRGAALLGLSLNGAPASVVAGAAASVGEPLARLVVDAAQGPVTPEARAAARALVASAGPVERTVGVARAIGLGVTARELGPGGPEVVAVVAQRLPPAVGDALLAMADAEAETPETGEA